MDLSSGNWTAIADELVEALARAPLSGRELRVVLALVRKTLGFGKARDRVSSSQLAALTELDPSNVRRIVRRLEGAGVIGRSDGGRTPLRWVVDDADAWRLGSDSTRVVDNPGQANPGHGRPGSSVTRVGANPGHGRPANPGRRRPIQETRERKNVTLGFAPGGLEEEEVARRVEALALILRDRSRDRRNLRSLVVSMPDAFGDLERLAYESHGKRRDGIVANAAAYFVASAGAFRSARLVKAGSGKPGASAEEGTR